MTNYREGACGPCNQGTLDVEDCQCPPPMTAHETRESGVEGVLARVLTEHVVQRGGISTSYFGPTKGWWRCSCGETSPSWDGYYHVEETGWGSGHVAAAQAAALAPVLAAERAKALRDAADRMPAFHDRDVPEWAITSACRWLRDRARGGE